MSGKNDPGYVGMQVLQLKAIDRHYKVYNKIYQHNRCRQKACWDE